MKNLTITRKNNIIDGFSIFGLYINDSKVETIKSNKTKFIKYHENDVLYVRYFFKKYKFNLNTLKNNERLYVSFNVQPLVFWIYLILNHLFIIIFLFYNLKIFFLLAIIVNILFLYYSGLRKDSIVIDVTN